MNNITNTIKNIKSRFKSEGVTYEPITIDNKTYEFYFKDAGICLFVIDEEEYNEKTIDKHYFKNLIAKFAEQNITLVLLYNSYFNNDKVEIVFSRLLYRLKNTAIKVEARQCEVKEVPYTECKTFLQTYHFQGNITSKYRIGLYYKDELISILLFNVPRYNKDFQYEIGRYAVKFNYNIRGNFTKMLSYFIEKYNPKSILTYHDILFGNNKVYEKAGFTKLEDSEPGFFWYKDGKTFNRRGFWKNTLKDKLEKFDPSLSAHTNMRQNGYTKVYDIGQGKFIWNKDASKV